MNTLKVKILILLMIISALACQWSGGSTQNEALIPVSTEAAIALNKEFEKAFQDANQKGSFVVELTEQLLTSYVALNLEKSNQVPITDLQIRLREEQIWISGILHQDNLQLPLSVVVGINVDSTNKLAIEINKARVGPFQMPTLILDTLTKEIERAFLEQVATLGEGVIIEEISIGEGSILIRGTKK